MFLFNIFWSPEYSARVASSLLIMGVSPLIRIIIAGFQKIHDRDEVWEDPGETDVDERSLFTMNTSL